MKSRFLLIALGYILICLFSNFKIRIFLAIILSIVFRYFFNERKALLAQVLFVVLILSSIPIEANYFGKGHVCSIKENYCIVNNHLYSVVVYGLNDVSLDDEVIINSEVKPIHSYNNFTTTTYESYCVGNNIIGTITNNHFKVNKSAFSLRRYLYGNNEKHNLWANTILFNKGIELDSENSYLIMASGMQLTFFIYFIRQLLAKFIYPKPTLQITILICLGLNLLLHFPYGLVRALLSLLAEYLIEDRKDRLSFVIVGLCLYRPYYVKSLSFLIPIGIRLLNLFKKSDNEFCITMYITLIQLYFNGTCNILQTFFFSLFRFVSGLLYCSAVYVSFLKISIPLDGFIKWYLSFVDHLNFVNIDGKPSIVILITLLFCIIQFNQFSKKRFAISFLIILLLNNFQSLCMPFYSITYLDVGQGDCAIIQTPFNKSAILIDVAGNIYKDIAKDIIVPYLNQQGIKSCNVIISHQDYDHCGGLESLNERFNVENIYREKQEELSFRGIKFVNPLFERVYENENDNSFINYFSIGQFNFLFTGDISSNVESDLVDEYPFLDIDVLKLSHHGSNTATSDKLLRDYKVSLGIISVDQNNRYGHPSKTVLQRLQKYDVKYLMTSEVGAIRIYCFRKLLFYITSRGQFGIVVK